MSGYFKNFEENVEETDIHALENGYVSIVPVNADMTCYQTYKSLKDWRF
jgi:5'-nucleotidase